MFGEVIRVYVFAVVDGSSGKIVSFRICIKGSDSDVPLMERVACEKCRELCESRGINADPFLVYSHEFGQALAIIKGGTVSRIMYKGGADPVSVFYSDLDIIPGDPDRNQDKMIGTMEGLGWVVGIEEKHENSDQ